MKKFLTKTFSSKPMTVCGVLFILIAATRLANADPLKEARVSQVIQDVRLLEAHGAPHPAAVNDKVTLGSAVRTGVESRAELTFNDLTITRVGANTIFSFTAGARQAELTQGAILLQVRPGAPPVRANTTAVTVAVTGGTALLSTGPPTKFMVLEGTGTIYPLGHPEKAVTVHGGEMVIAEGGRLSKPEEFDVKLVLETSLLILDFPPLANLPLILAVVDQQQAEQLVMIWNPPPYKSFFDVIDVTDLNANSNPAVIEVRLGTPTPTPAPPPPPPSKFGTPSTITSPNPYLITSGTTITTDPSITTNGVTDFGKIYRGATDDGPFTLWAFGSTSAFDTALNIDTEFFADPSHLPIAAFKFQSLSLTGNPTIDTSNSGVTKLALIGVNGITSGSPGGTLTFTGLDLLVLATVNGSINLTSDVSFQGLNELAMYARGAGSNLILNSPISNIGTLELAAQGSIQLTNPGTMSVGEFEASAGNNLTLQIGGSLLLNGDVDLNTLVLPGTTVANGANVTLNITGDYANNSTTDPSRLRVRNEGAHIGTGGNIGVNIGGNLTAMNDFSLAVQNTNGQIDNGGNLNLTVGGTTSTTSLVLNVDSSAGGFIDNGGNVTLHTVGPVMLDGPLVLEVDNFNGGTINNGANVTAHFVGDVTDTVGDFHSLNWNLLNGSGFFNPTATGGTIGTGGDINVTFDGNASTTGTSTTGSISAQIQNGNGGSIGTGGNISVTVGGNLTAGPLFFMTENQGGHIGTGGNMTLHVAGDITTQGDAHFEMFNNDNGNGSGPGTIGLNATINVNAANISSAGALFDNIFNYNGGNIGGNADVSFNLTGSLTTQGDATFQILNNDGGQIGGAANISFTTGGDLTANSINAFINNRNGGSITSGANLIFNVGAALSTTGDATFVISNRNDSGGGGTIGGDVNLTFSAASISVGGILVTDVSTNRGGHIIGSAHNSVNAAGLLSGSTLDFEIENAGYDDGGGFAPGGTIDSGAILSVTASDISTTSDYFNALIWNAGGGHIGGNATLDISASNRLTAGGDAYFSIINSPNGEDTPAGTIGGNATIQANIGSMSVGGLLDVVIDNTDGSIGGNATVNMNVAGSANVTNDATVAIYGSDGADSSAININGGSYNVGGTFLTYIDGNGTITFNNATAHADVLKAGVFGANGVLNIGGGILSADSELKLYAPGSNGSLNFISNVTLGGNSIKILAANSVTILNNIVVTIGGPNPADVYVNFVGGVPNANYSEEWGGNGNTTGTFAGAGAHNPQPLDQAPPFGASPSGHTPGGIRTNPPVINVSNTEELLALLDGAAVGPNGRITISDSNSKRNLRNLSRINMNSLQRRERRMLFHEMRERSNMRLGGRRIL